MAKPPRTHYDNLKVSRDAPPEVIRAAYKSLSQKYHPDRNQGSKSAESIMKIINQAYVVLSDPEKRAAYDVKVARDESHLDFGQADAPSSPKKPQPKPANAMKPDEKNIQALFDKGIQYYSGQGVRQDFALAGQWFRKAADQGFAQAQSSLGFLYESGLGVPQDYALAAQWYRKAADQGLAQGQANLGFLYKNGLGVPRSKESAVFWFEKVAAQGGDAGKVAEELISKINNGG